MSEGRLESQFRQNQERGMALLDKLVDVAQPGTVYGAPVTVGEHTVITASEVSVGMGFGWGGGSKAKPELAQGEAESDIGAGGGGGGGGSSGRPVAVIKIGPQGVEVTPVIDMTKIGLALLTTLGTMALTLGRMRRGR
jgi:uncharacterized spore protein YtfJ